MSLLPKFRSEAMFYRIFLLLRPRKLDGTFTNFLLVLSFLKIDCPPRSSANFKPSMTLLCLLEMLLLLRGIDLTLGVSDILLSCLFGGSNRLMFRNC